MNTKTLQAEYDDKYLKYFKAKPGSAEEAVGPAEMSKS